MLRYRLPDGRSWKRLWEGWVGSFTMLLVLLDHRARKMSRMDGRGAPMIFAAVFTVRWRVLRSAALQFPYPDLSWRPLDCFSLSHSSIASVCCAAVRFVIVALLFY